MDHPNIAKVFDAGATEKGRSFFVLELVAGEAITRYCDRHQLSPEQAERVLDIDGRTDIYSLGVVLYELLAGCLPVDGGELRSRSVRRLGEVFQATGPPVPSSRMSGQDKLTSTIAADRRTQPAALRRELRGDLDWIAMKALERDRERRLDGASELAEEIARHSRHQPVLAGPPTFVCRTSKFLRRHRLGVTVAASILALLLTFTVLIARHSIELGWALEQSERETRKAAEVSSFLSALFAVVDPAESRGGSLELRR